jgi:hypothetical protein
MANGLPEKVNRIDHLPFGIDSIVRYYDCDKCFDIGGFFWRPLTADKKILCVFCLPERCLRGEISSGGWSVGYHPLQLIATAI